MSENNIYANGGEELPNIEIPLSKAEEQSSGLIGTATTGKCQDVSGDHEEARTGSASQALAQLGYLNEDEVESYEKKMSKLKRKLNEDENRKHSVKRKPTDEGAVSQSRPNDFELKELPKILLPKDGKFKSFRHSLLLYSQRKYSKIPQYKTEKEHYGFIGMVIINGETIRSKVIAPHEKEADARAAFQALTQFGYLEGMSFEMQHNLQMGKDADGEENQEKLTGNAKCDLNEFAQKGKISLPSYTFEQVPGGYMATVTFNKCQYKSLSVRATRKDAEQNAAQVALNAVIGAPLPNVKPVSEGIKEKPIKEKPFKEKQIPKVQPVSFKNLLQEYCQRSSFMLPSYTTTGIGNQNYQAVVSVNGVDYKGNAVKGKKASENSAAEMALKALNLPTTK